MNANTTIETWVRDINASEEEAEGELETDSCCICRETFTEGTVIRKLNRCRSQISYKLKTLGYQNNTTCPLYESSVRPLLIDITSNEKTMMVMITEITITMKMEEILMSEV